jgi:hypothetical protein
MNKLEELLAEWKKDSEIDRTEPGRAMLDIPKLHSKYLNILSHYRQLTRQNEFKFSKMKVLKWEYYTGKLDQETLKQYGWEPFPYVLKSDINTYLEGDDDLNKIIASKIMCQEIVSCCESIMKELHSRTFQLKSFIEYERFIQGA